MGIILTGIYIQFKNAYDHSHTHQHRPPTTSVYHSADLFSILTLAAEALHLVERKRGVGVVDVDGYLSWHSPCVNGDSVTIESNLVMKE